MNAIKREKGRETKRYYLMKEEKTRDLPELSLYLLLLFLTLTNIFLFFLH